MMLMMKFVPITKISGAYVIEKQQHSDERGVFERAFCVDQLTSAGLETNFPQCNVSMNPHKHTLRGLHFQDEPHSEVKIVTCVSGVVFDVLLDLRDRKNIVWQGFYLREGDGRSLYIPKGVAHGFLTLTNDSTLMYFVSSRYNKEADRGVRWNDPKCGIFWPSEPKVISEKDKNYPLL